MQSQSPTEVDVPSLVIPRNSGSIQCLIREIIRDSDLSGKHLSLEDDRDSVGSQTPVPRLASLKGIALS